jgi:hypothetical protein
MEHSVTAKIPAKLVQNLAAQKDTESLFGVVQAQKAQDILLILKVSQFI